ncbi:MAG TPA: hypothetical protein PKA20_16485 [Burkholderiaceae bacterium]|nr:hypothetical protein [Burkholderiaceae bacterium]
MYRRNGCESDAAVCFLGLEFTGIEQRGPGQYSVTLQLPWGRQRRLHALTLDFDLHALEQLLDALPDELRAPVDGRLREQTGAQRIELPRPVRARMVECEPGQMRHEADGAAVVPFSVKRIETGELAAA